jgi:inorganic pyrophosphatase
MQLENFSPVHGKKIFVVIETPRGSQHKYDYDKRLQMFALHKTLPMGTVFPFDFGFIPNTIGEDGDPLDVLVLMEEPAFAGCLVECRVLGILMATQTEKNAKPVRNDRIIAVADCSVLFASVRKVKELNVDMAKEIENFFIDYNKNEGKKFKPIKFDGPKNAMKLISKGMHDFNPKEK